MAYQATAGGLEGVFGLCTLNFLSVTKCPSGPDT